PRDGASVDEETAPMANSLAESGKSLIGSSANRVSHSHGSTSVASPPVPGVCAPATIMVLDEAVRAADLQVKLLLNEKEGQDKHSRELELSLREAENQISLLQSQNNEVRLELREAEQRQHEAEQQTASQKQVCDDERSRHVLALRLATENAASSQKMLSQQGQELHKIRSQVRAQESDLARLKIEKEGCSEFAATLQNRLDEVAGVITAVERSEACFKDTVRIVREDHAALKSKLERCNTAILKLKGNDQLLRQLRASQEDASQARADLDACRMEIRRKEAELSASREDCASKQLLLEEADRQIQARHNMVVQSDLKSQQLAEQLQESKQVTAQQDSSSSIIPHRIYLLIPMPQRAMHTTEAYDKLTCKFTHNSIVVQVLLRELVHADANAQAAQLRTSLEQRNCNMQIREHCIIANYAGIAPRQ
ncbi:MAG: hypothetical protein SGPRY_005829, partial [Prymnesium sp.]